MAARQGSLAVPVRCHYAGRRPRCALTAEVRYGTIALRGPCAATRSSVGKATAPVPLPADPPVDVLDWIANADAAVAQARRQLAGAVARARALRCTWTQIAGQLGTTRQAAQQRFTRPTGDLG